MKVLDVRWFTSAKGCVGIVRCEDKYDGIKYYISAVSGLNENTDIQFVKDWGGSFPKDAGDVLFGVKIAVPIN